jgi:hypothetical protein
VTIFGASWDELTLEHVQTFLDSADDEPLLWEAKGTRLDSKEVRLQVCGFANSHEGGYLVLGASRVTANGETRWELGGFVFPDEPATWVANVVTDLAQGVRPRPVFDVRSWPVSGRHVALIRIEPTSTPPCIANGTVYERLPGKTQTVREPLRLAALFTRGDEARSGAQTRADRAAATILGAWNGEVENVAETFRHQGQIDESHTARAWLRFAVGVAATGNAPEIGRRLFQPEFVEQMWNSLWEQQVGVPEQFRSPPDTVRFTQAALLCRHDVSGPLDHVTLARASWDGATAAGQRLMTDHAYPDSLIDARLRPAWQLADDLLQRLGGYGDVYVTLLVAGKRFLNRQDDEPVAIRRGPVAAGVDDTLVASVSREMMRAVGNAEYEPS